jgi:hypothetical protein
MMILPILNNYFLIRSFYYIFEDVYAIMLRLNKVSLQKNNSTSIGQANMV